MISKALAASAILVATTTSAQPPRPGREGISRTLAACVKSWDRSDAAAIASQFEPDGDFVSPDGMYASGRSAVRSFYSAAFANGYAHSRGDFAIRSVRLVGSNLAIVDGVWTIAGAHDRTGKHRSPERGLAVALLRNHPTGWKIVALREQASATDLHDFPKR